MNTKLNIDSIEDGSIPLSKLAEDIQGNIDPELLEGFIPLSRDFSDDFNNDFAR